MYAHTHKHIHTHTHSLSLSLSFSLSWRVCVCERESVSLSLSWLLCMGICTSSSDHWVILEREDKQLRLWCVPLSFQQWSLILEREDKCVMSHQPWKPRDSSLPRTRSMFSWIHCLEKWWPDCACHHAHRSSELAPRMELGVQTGMWHVWCPSWKILVDFCLTY